MVTDSPNLVRRGRPWADGTVWGALWMLSTGDAPGWLADHQPSRIRRRLQSLSTGGLAWAVRTRAEVYRFRASQPVRRSLRRHLVVTGAEALGLDTESLDGYLTPEGFEWIRRDFPIVPDAEAANVTLRVSRFTSTVDAKRMPVGFAAADMADSVDQTEAEQGLLTLDDLVRTFQGRRRHWLTVAEIADALAGENDEVFALRILAKALTDTRNLSEPADLARFLRRPATTGDQRRDVLLAAAIARECRHRDIETPRWTDVAGLEPWWFPALVDRSLIPLTIRRTPPELARKGIFLDEKALATV